VRQLIENIISQEHHERKREDVGTDDNLSKDLEMIYSGGCCQTSLKNIPNFLLDIS